MSVNLMNNDFFFMYLPELKKIIDYVPILYTKCYYSVAYLKLFE